MCSQSSCNESGMQRINTCACRGATGTKLISYDAAHSSSAWLLVGRQHLVMLSKESNAIDQRIQHIIRIMGLARTCQGYMPEVLLVPRCVSGLTRAKYILISKHMQRLRETNPTWRAV